MWKSLLYLQRERVSQTLHEPTAHSMHIFHLSKRAICLGSLRHFTENIGTLSRRSGHHLSMASRLLPQVHWPSAALSVCTVCTDVDSSELKAEPNVLLWLLLSDWIRGKEEKKNEDELQQPQRLYFHSRVKQRGEIFTMPLGICQSKNGKAGRYRTQKESDSVYQERR